MMRESDVYVLSSDRGEGWGAVAGEAMAEGCVLIANEQAGSARELIVDGVTGFLFRDGDVGQLASLLIRVGSDTDLRMRVRASAWNLVSTVWSPSVAAERLVALCGGLLGYAPLPTYLEGPCSRVHLDR
jgi:glycosyltransferase involved in cell wall biosynthesis